MIKLGKREEQIMHACWKLRKAFVRDIIAELPQPQPHYNTIATMVKTLEDKGFLAHESVGNMLCYYPLISKELYQKDTMNEFVTNFFENSYSRMLTYFAKEEEISDIELNELLTLIKSKKK
ncbi:BlaI/MecI/CopY family transcriptional regulator [Mucilaginibacter sp. X5P1]|uniref:BlaI/MecI/CopY family transcriptional regulator n=1 Tax=Mucilaginibacter sp. X5P1 TaxID=2723088 RepID=UPI00161D3530|nr:BlaI/MecI/CopY family transcriptional regulator [Mucilaginibacter sp. X5P1]MBB6139312.1 putative transcriptional regulator [Mucilaginibacter sp. X5P1]